MFDRYTESARRTIFFARFEASQFGCPQIETEHLLLGLLREDEPLAVRFLGSRARVESIRREIEDQPLLRKLAPSEADLPFSPECGRALERAAAEADRLGSSRVGTEHLLLALLCEDTGLAGQLLREQGLTPDSVRHQIARRPHGEEARGAAAGDAPGNP
jgi:ATP-dependent Clp protease ATP-binding subunit ClpC